MALSKENKGKEIPKAVGLDDNDPEQNEKAVAKISLLQKYRKYLMPAAIITGSLAVAISAALFIGPSKEEMEEVATDEKPEQAALTKSLTDDLSGESKSQEIAKAGGNKLQNTEEIDTALIMAELAFLNYVPDMEAEEDRKKQQVEGTVVDSANSSGTAVSDSADTMNWLAKELAKLEAAKVEEIERIATLKALEQKIDLAIARISQTEASNISNLARLYDGMRPEQVSKLFENLDDEAIMAILPKMKAANAAKILAYMPPKRAAAISTKMITILEE